MVQYHSVDGVRCHLAVSVLALQHLQQFGRDFGWKGISEWAPYVASREEDCDEGIGMADSQGGAENELTAQLGQLKESVAKHAAGFSLPD